MLKGSELKIFLLSAIIIFISSLWSCKTSEKIVMKEGKNNEAGEKTDAPNFPYRASATKLHDLIHTRLEVSFDWPNRHLLGDAELTFKPHFTSTNKLYLNARGMEISEVKIVKGEIKEELAYEYKNDSIHITLDKFYTKQDTFKIYINYIAKPDELPKGGSAAIMEDKGLYFINADNSDPYKPQQIWTQGETQASSVWFPTIDFTNQKTTQEIYITVDTSFVTLSNGVLVSSIVNSYTGFRTDYWRQNIPHAPYLVMMAIGKFAVVKDKWRNIETNYYVEPEYEKYAAKIFGHTPEMLDFFSRIFGIDYPWEKYSQVVVRDYVSGAMENTTAVVYGEFVQKDDRALLDENNDDYVAHELSHHWFGNLVTCESWANLPLNEAFATYSEYLWFEYKYGRDEGDYVGQKDLNNYLREARNKQVDLVRFEYDRQEDMFDNHSYAKGGRVLHMLRKYVGEEAFFASLKLYLEQNKFNTAEIHDLRMAFEKVTGEDLNWFFNQWFLDKGHPTLKIDYLFDETTLQQLITVEQTQDFTKNPLYKIPIDVDIYTSNGVSRERITLTQQKETFLFKVSSKPDLVNFDAQKMLLCTKADNHTNDEWIAMYKRAPLYLDRMEALSKIAKSYEINSAGSEVIKLALNDPHWHVRSTAIKNCKGLIKENREEIKNTLMKLASSDPKSDVRDEALIALSESYSNDETVSRLMRAAINDSSYMVMGTAITSLIENDRSEGITLLKQMESDTNQNVNTLVSDIYTAYGDDDQFEYMTSALSTAKGSNKYSAVRDYGKFLLRCKPSNVAKGIETLAEVGTNFPLWYVRLAAAQSLSEISKSYGQTSLRQTKDSPDQTDPILKEREETEKSNVRKRAEELLLEMKATEKDESLLKIYGRD